MTGPAILSLTCILAAVGSSTAYANTFYVAPNGNDSWSGRLSEPKIDGTDGPFLTIEAARDAIRRLKSEGFLENEVSVLVRGGVYRLTRPVVFEPEDSGTAAAPITYRSYPGESPVVSGGRLLEGWKPEGPLWTLELPEVKAGSWQFSALWINGKHRHPARSPNNGFFYTAGKASAIADPATGAERDRSKTAFQYTPGDIQRWENLEDAVVVVFHSWDTSYGRIAELDEATHTVTFKSAAAWPFENWGPRQRYFIENVFEALDQPGEWYLNRKTGVLYYWPREGETMENTEVVAPVVEHVVLFKGDIEQGRFVEHLRIQGLRFRHTEYSIPPEGLRDFQAAYPVTGALHANGARHCSIEDCEVSQISNYAVWFRLGCQNNRFLRNHLHHLGAGGVRLGDGADPPSEHAVTMRNRVENNWIHDGGLIFPAAVGVWIGRSSYNTVSHNEISDLYYTGISVGWSWGYAPSSAHHNLIEFNHIHDIGKGLLSDMGGIYTLGIAPGTILRNNLIHDVYSYTYGGWGIYPDEGSSDLLIENNVVYNTKTGGFHQHYGRENRVFNNIFAFSLEGQVQRSREEEHLSFFFERNIVYFDQGALLSGTWKNNRFLMDWNCYSQMDSIAIEFAGKTIEEWRAMGQDIHSIVADPKFEDPKRSDFRLKPDSPVWELGFRAIPIHQAGIEKPPRGPATE